MSDELDPSVRIERYIAEHDDWRGALLAQIRAAILAADPGVEEEWKWMGSPVWSHTGQLVVANAHKDKVKITFAQGAHLEDAGGLFNAGLDGKRWRAIDLFEGDELDAAALTALIRTAIDHNRSKRATKRRR